MNFCQAASRPRPLTLSSLILLSNTLVPLSAPFPHGGLRLELRKLGRMLRSSLRDPIAVRAFCPTTHTAPRVHS
ncbi:hypothetical protein BDQ17DRAFT_1361775 [Cyathus striatus]|nr:hypothetical protein BDQ17DRAFT_1361775 [Cyathus striatus]